MGVTTNPHLRKRGLFAYVISTQGLSEGLRAIRPPHRRKLAVADPCPPRPIPWRATRCLSSRDHRLRLSANVGTALECLPALSQQIPNLRDPRRGDAEHFGGRAGRFARGECQGNFPKSCRQPAQPFREVDPAGSNVSGCGPLVFHKNLAPAAFLFTEVVESLDGKLLAKLGVV